MIENGYATLFCFSKEEKRFINSGTHKCRIRTAKSVESRRERAAVKIRIPSETPIEAELRDYIYPGKCDSRYIEDFGKCIQISEIHENLFGTQPHYLLYGWQKL